MPVLSRVTCAKKSTAKPNKCNASVGYIFTSVNFTKEIRCGLIQPLLLIDCCDLPLESTHYMMVLIGSLQSLDFPYVREACRFLRLKVLSTLYQQSFFEADCRLV